jgi:nitroimidazol reductase NimA-like FMN-containing flavoprotein (pyridoxamine 5'-phosphate oxidase superfamily)
MTDPAAAPVPSHAVVRRHPERGRYDRASVEAILKEGLVCHVAFATEHGPVVIPTAYAPFEGGIVLHGARASRMMQALTSGAPASVAVTHLDGLVLARSATHHSMNYRSVVLQGTAREIAERDRKCAALDAFVDHVAPGRRGSVRAPSEAELAGTRVAWFPADAASAKVRTGPPVDLDGDHALDAWAGVLPLGVRVGAPEADPALREGIPLPDHVARWAGPGSRA